MTIMSQERIFAIKLSELEHQYEQTLGCLKSYQTEDRQKIQQDLEQVFEKYQPFPGSCRPVRGTALL